MRGPVWEKSDSDLASRAAVPIEDQPVIGSGRTDLGRSGATSTSGSRNAQEVGAAVCSTNTGGTSAPGGYFITVARSAPRMSPLEW